jgi:aminopeptidase N
LEEVAEVFGQKEEWDKIEKPHTFCFKTTPKISSYLYAVVAGPYEYFEEL